MLEPVIGLEVHLAIKTRTKMFCACPTESIGREPNSVTCPVCLGLPGSLPVANGDALERAIRFSLALHCAVPDVTQFHRKNYFYPDAPKNYQISQYDRPIGEHGFLELPSEGGAKRIRIKRCHVEEDAGRSVHPTYADHSLIDLNRCGAPLIEMVTEPDVASGDEAREFLVRVRAIAQALEVSDANPEDGKMRADVNISLRAPGGPLGTKVEVKNLNSFKSVQRAIEFEIRRQTRVLEDGGSIRQDTLGWDEGGQKTYLMRTKEGEADYRYFPDPDLPVIRITSAWRERIERETPELPDAKRERYVARGVRPADATVLAFDTPLARFFDRTLAAYDGDAQAVANWLTGDVAGWLNTNDATIEAVTLTPERLAALVRLVETDAISGRSAKDILPDVMQGADPDVLVEERGLRQITDHGAIEGVVDDVIARNPAVVAQIATNPKAINALLGQVMKETRGKAKPDAVREALERKLGLTVTN